MLRRSLPAALACLAPGAALAQTSFLAPDGHNRFPGVTIFCPSGTGVAPCSFGSGGGGASGAVSINLGGVAVSSSNRLPISDPTLDALVSGGAMSVTGTVGLSGSPTVSLGAGSLTIGGVTQSGSWTVGLSPGASIGLSAGSNDIGQVDVASLPALPAGANAIGSVAVSNLPVLGSSRHANVQGIWAFIAYLIGHGRPCSRKRASKQKGGAGRRIESRRSHNRSPAGPDAALDMTLKSFDPTQKPTAIRARMKRKTDSTFRRNELMRAILAVLRSAKKPVGIRDLALAVAATEGLELPTQHARSAFVANVRAAMRRPREGLIKEPATGGGFLWSLDRGV